MSTTDDTPTGLTPSLSSTLPTNGSELNAHTWRWTMSFDAIPSRGESLQTSGRQSDSLVLVPGHSERVLVHGVDGLMDNRIKWNLHACVASAMRVCCCDTTQELEDDDALSARSCTNFTRWFGPPSRISLF